MLLLPTLILGQQQQQQPSLLLHSLDVMWNAFSFFFLPSCASSLFLSTALLQFNKMTSKKRWRGPDCAAFFLCWPFLSDRLLLPPQFWKRLLLNIYKEHILLSVRMCLESGCLSIYRTYLNAVLLGSCLLWVLRATLLVSSTAQVKCYKIHTFFETPIF
jgi:hypothetical protein